MKMNRREFIQALTVVGIALPALLQDVAAQSPPLLDAPASSKPMSAPGSHIYLVSSIHATGMSGSGDIRLMRSPSLVLFVFHVSHGGFLQWRAGIHDSILFPAGIPPIVDADDGIDWAMPLIDLERGNDSMVMGRYGGREFLERIYARAEATP